MSQESIIETAQSKPYRWLLVLAAGLTIMAILTMGTAMRYLEDRLIDTAGENLALATAEIADKIDRLLFERYGDAAMLARTFVSHPHDYAFITEHLVWMKESYSPLYRWLGVADAQGRIVASTESARLGQDVSHTDWFTSARDRQRVYLGDIDAAEMEEGVLMVAAPMKDRSGHFVGVVTSRVGLDMIEAVMTRTVRAMKDEPGFAGAVEYQFLTGDGVAFIDSLKGSGTSVNLREAKTPSVLLSASGKPGYVQEQHSRRKVKVVTGYARGQDHEHIKNYGWTVLLRRDHSDILRPIRNVLSKLWMASAAVGIPALGLLFWSARRLRRESVQAQYESQCARAAEAALVQSQQRIKAVVDTALDAVISMDAEGRVTEWNVQAVRLFGWTRHEAVGRSFAEIVIPPRYREMYEQGLHHFLTTGEGPFFNRRVETTASRKDGREFPVELTVSPSLIGHTHIFSVFVRDISDRRQTEQRLAAQFAVTQVVAEAQTMDEAIPKILHSVAEHLQWSLGIFWMVEGGPVRLLRCFEVWVEHPGFAEEFVGASWRATFESGVGLPGRVFANGRAAWVRDVVTDPNFPRREAAFQAGLHGAFCFPVKVGGEVAGVVELFSREVREPDEELIRMADDLGLRLGQFMTRLRAEDALRHTEDQLRQSQKMEAVGRLAGGVAHDFNNLLTVIRGYCELILGRLRDGEPMKKEVEEVKKAGDRAAGLTNQLLAFSRRQFVTAKVVNLNEIISGMDGMLRRLIGEDLIELCTNLSPDLANIKADPGQVEQVIMNLAVNAHDAMQTGGKMTIETKNVSIDKTHPLAPFALEPGKYVSLIVSDTGYGMDEKTQTHIFEPFFTTKEKGKGTGLGLSTVYGIVKQSGGHIEVESAPGKGACFKMYFPRLDEATPSPDLKPAAVGGVNGKETVLVVEDEPAVRILVQETLRMHGYQVLMARHGIEALLTGAKHMGPIHLLLTDVVMPQMSGPEVADKLCQARRDMKVLYMSGYPDHPAFEQGEVRTKTLLQKPFSPHELAQKVREVLDRPTAPTQTPA